MLRRRKSHTSLYSFFPYSLCLIKWYFPKSIFALSYIPPSFHLIEMQPDTWELSTQTVTPKLKCDLGTLGIQALQKKKWRLQNGTIATPQYQTDSVPRAPSPRLQTPQHSCDTGASKAVMADAAQSVAFAEHMLPGIFQLKFYYFPGYRNTRTKIGSFMNDIGLKIHFMTQSCLIFVQIYTQKWYVFFILPMLV